MRALIAYAVVIALAACKSEAPQQLELDRAALTASLDARTRSLLQRPAVSAAVGTCMATIQASSAWEHPNRLMATKLMANPDAVMAIGSFFVRLERDMNVDDLASDVSVPPGATDDDVRARAKALLEERFERGVADLPATLWSDALLKLDTTPVTTALGRRVHDAGERVYSGEWTGKLRRLADGTSLSPGRASALVIDHVLTPARLERFALAVLTSRPVCEAIATFFAGIYADAMLQKEIVETIVALGKDEQVQARGVAVFQAALTGDSAATETAVRALLAEPGMASAGNRVMRAAVKTNGAADLADVLITKLAAEPTVRAAYDDLMKRW